MKYKEQYIKVQMRDQLWCNVLSYQFTMGKVFSANDGGMPWDAGNTPKAWVADETTCLDSHYPVLAVTEAFDSLSGIIVSYVHDYHPEPYWEQESQIPRDLGSNVPSTYLSLTFSQSIVRFTDRHSTDTVWVPGIWWELLGTGNTVMTNTVPAFKELRK